MCKACEDFEAELKESNGERDHGHLLIHYLPKIAVSKLVNSLKGASASNGGAQQAIFRQYVEQQKSQL